MDERSAGVLSSSTAAAACQIASALAGGDEGARAEASSTSFSSKASETAVVDCLFSVSRGFSNFAGLLLALDWALKWAKLQQRGSLTTTIERSGPGV